MARQGRFQQGIRKQVVMMAESKSSTTEVAINKGLSLFDSGNYKGALEMFNSAEGALRGTFNMTHIQTRGTHAPSKQNRASALFDLTV